MMLYGHVNHFVLRLFCKTFDDSKEQQRYFLAVWLENKVVFLTIAKTKQREIVPLSLWEEIQ